MAIYLITYKLINIFYNILISDMSFEIKKNNNNPGIYDLKKKKFLLCDKAAQVCGDEDPECSAMTSQHSAVWQ